MNPSTAAAAALLAAAAWRFGVGRTVLVISLAATALLSVLLRDMPTDNAGHRAGGHGFGGPLQVSQCGLLLLKGAAASRRQRGFHMGMRVYPGAYSSINLFNYVSMNPNPSHSVSLMDLRRTRWRRCVTSFAVTTAKGGHCLV